MRAMKDSGVEWIGEIPESWNVSKLKYLGDFINGYAFKPEDWGDNGLPIIRIQDLTGSNSSPNFYNGVIDEKYYVACGDILVSWAATLDAFIWNKEPGWLNQHIFKAINKNSVYKKWFYWMLKVTMQNMNNDNKHGIVMQHVTLDVFDNYRIPLPDVQEQQCIADYLDAKCSKIDAIISKQEAVIEKLKAYKQSIITEAVTKGLNPDVEMKDSGYEHIGLIPGHWALCRVRNIGVTQNGISKGSEYFGQGYPFVSYGDVYKNYSLPFDVQGKVESTDEERERYSVVKGDIFFTRTSETIDEVGFSSVCEQTIENATFAGFLIRLRPANDTLHTGYAKYYFRSDHQRAFLAKQMNLVTRASLSQDLLKSMPVTLPPKEEQAEIVDYLDAKCSNIDSIIANKQSVIEKLTEYKKSLIYEVVTGKKEV